jgi:citrate/tricarballylate utilization protein
MHGTRILEEADRLMTVCNSCRYCEGLCAVFPAMEMRRAFSDGDLNYLANLCHGCGACYTDCQFSPPHQFNVNVPKTLAIARAESYAAYAWPHAFSGVFARNGLVISMIAALSVAAFIFGFAAFNDRQVLFGIHTGPGAFYALMPHNAMAALFGAAFLYAIVALAMGVRAFWRDIGDLSSPDVLWLFAVFRRDIRGDAVSLPVGARGAVSVVGPAGAAGHAWRRRTSGRTFGPA